MKLTAREHYVAHMLLWKDYRKRYGDLHWKSIKMMQAFWLMANTMVSNSKVYSAVREAYSSNPEIRARRSIAMTGEGNPNFGKIATPEKRANISAGLVGKNRGVNNRMYGKKHPPETIARQSASKMGELNPMFGRKVKKETKDKRFETKTGAARSVFLDRIKDLVLAEDPKAPIKDNQILRILEEEGFAFSKSSVRKHREALGFKSSGKRGTINPA